MEDPAMKLFGTYLSPFTRRVAVALTSRAIAYEHDDLNGYADPARARALNPVGKVPVLVLDDGEHLIDSAAILDYIDQRVGHDQGLVPRAGRERRVGFGSLPSRRRSMSRVRRGTSRSGVWAAAHNRTSSSDTVSRHAVA
jgi:hypothetical protein